MTEESQGELTFYCRDCDRQFVAMPDGTGYDQTVCPVCDASCMTVEFEQEERNRLDGEATFFSVLGSLTGFFNLHIPEDPRRPDTSPVPIASYEDHHVAERDAEVLASSGIEATLQLNTAGNDTWYGRADRPVVQLCVVPRDASRAKRLLRETARHVIAEDETAVEDVVFPCEECGQTLSFAGHRRGKVETCPRCYEYVDVPE